MENQSRVIAGEASGRVGDGTPTFYQKYKSSIIASRNKWLAKDGNKERAKEMSRIAGRKRNERIKKELQDYDKLKEDYQKLLDQYNLLSNSNEENEERQF